MTALRGIHSRPAPPSAAQVAALPGAIRRLRGDGPADASVIIPLNAQGDLDHVVALLCDVGRYDGQNRLEVIVVLNNYGDGEEPGHKNHLEDLGVRVISIPNVRRRGEAVSFTARIPGVRAATAAATIHFDADCRVPYPGRLIDWYIDSLRDNGAAYGPVRFHSVPPGRTAEAAVAAHHLTRWAKRMLIRIPTLRGSSYAADRDLMLTAYDGGQLADDMNVGPVIKATGAGVAYGSGERLTVRTSGRMYLFTWLGLMRYLRYRLRYNLRVIPVRQDAADHTGREHDPVRTYIDDRPIR